MKDELSAPRRNAIAASDGPTRKINHRSTLQSVGEDVGLNSMGTKGAQAHDQPSETLPLRNQHSHGNVFVLPLENGHSPSNRCSENISSTSDEVMPRTKSFMSDPIGHEQDLGSGGPLDDGIGLCLTACNGHDTALEKIGLVTDANASMLLNRTPSRVAHSWAFEGSDHSSSSPGASPLGSGVSTISSRHYPYQTKLATPSPIRSGPKQCAPNGIAHEQASCPSNSPRSMHAAYPAPVEPIAVNIYNRKSGRSRTSQGIPAHKLRLLLGESASILEESPVDRSDRSEDGNEEKERIMEELQMYKERAEQLEEQVKVLHALLEDKVRDQLALAALPRTDANGESKNDRLWDANAHLGTPYGGFSPGAMSFADSLPSMTMSPDPFSPFHAALPSPHFLSPKERPYAADPSMITDKHRGLDAALSIPGAKRMPYELGSQATLDSVTIAESPYLTGLRVNLNGLDVQDAVPNQAQQVAGGGEMDVNASSMPSTAPVQSPFQSQMSFPSSFATLSSSMIPSDLVTSSFRNSNGGNVPDERNGRLLGADCHVSPEALVSRALSARNQEASIVLQQQLKTASTTRKAAIVRAIAPHILKLADDKHGNFLIQRAIGVDPQLAWRLQRRFVSLSLSQFGCHVVQKLLDEHEELHKTIVTELLADRVLETLTCKNSIHIWQKVFELRWADNGDMRAKIFSTVNATLRGRWADTAMLETGSIICQNIFESAGESEKRECLSEILQRLGECASNQWGVWVVQHIIEHSGAETKKAAFQQLLKSAARLTLSQYGQKAIMSALKSRDPEFVAAYIDILCDRDVSMASINGAQDAQSPNGGSVRRSVLVDVSTAPQGVQIVTQLLTSVTPEQRERIIKTVRKNSVFLKGSKAGLRVHQLCERARAFTGY